MKSTGSFIAIEVCFKNLSINFNYYLKIIIIIIIIIITIIIIIITIIIIIIIIIINAKKGWIIAKPGKGALASF